MRLSHLDNVEKHNLILRIVCALKLALCRVFDNLVDSRRGVDRGGRCTRGKECIWCAIAESLKLILNPL